MRERYIDVPPLVVEISNILWPGLTIGVLGERYTRDVVGIQTIRRGIPHRTSYPLSGLSTCTWLLYDTGYQDGDSQTRTRVREGPDGEYNNDIVFV